MKKKTLAMLSRFATICFGLLTSCNVKANYQIPEHQSNWAIYQKEIAGFEGMVMVDLGLDSIAPVQHFSKLLTITVPIINPEVNGWPGSEELEVHQKMEDIMDSLVRKQLNGISAGRKMYDAKYLYCFYIPTENGVDELINNISKYYPKYAFSPVVSHDASWNTYKNELLPNEFEYQAMLIGQVLAQMQEAGDRLEKPRVVDHNINFSNTADRDRFAKAILAEGFTLPDSPYSEGTNNYPYSINIERIDVPHYENIKEITFHLRKLAKQYNGEYEGWSSLFVKE